MTFGTGLREPFDQQVAFFRGKLGNLVPTEKWTDMQKNAHDTGFMVAGAQSGALLADMAAAVDRAIAHGDSLDQFRKNFKSIAAEHGWAYRGEFNWRTRTIYQTNMSTSYNAGRLAQLVEGAFAYWVYIHSKTVQHPRKEHQAWDSVTLPPDDPWWKSHFTPNGWGCQCRVKGSNRLKANSITVAPDSPIDPKTGTAHGIDPGWDYMPGSTVVDRVRAVTQSTIHWPDVLTKKFMETQPDSVRDPMSHAYRKLPSVADEARRFAKAHLEGRQVGPRFAYLGLMESRDVSPIQSMTFRDPPNRKKGQRKEISGLDVRGYDFLLDESGVKHIVSHHGNQKKEEKQGQRAVVADDYAMIPRILNDPDMLRNAGFPDKGMPAPQVAYSKVIDGELYTLVMEHRPNQKAFAVKTMYIRPGGTI